MFLGEDLNLQVGGVKVNCGIFSERSCEKKETLIANVSFHLLCQNWLDTTSPQHSLLAPLKAVIVNRDFFFFLFHPPSGLYSCVCVCVCVSVCVGVCVCVCVCDHLPPHFTPELQRSWCFCVAVFFFWLVSWISPQVHNSKCKLCCSSLRTPPSPPTLPTPPAPITHLHENNLKTFSTNAPFRPEHDTLPVTDDLVTWEWLFCVSCLVCLAKQFSVS